MSRIYLSPPDVGDLEQEYVAAAIASNWVAPVGPDLDAFEREIAEVVGVPHAVGLASGTAALHLALKELGVGPGDDVIVPTFTFAATANAVTYLGAQPVFVDSDPATWNISPELLAEELANRRRHGSSAKAVVVVDLYGRCADYGRLLPLCEAHGLPVIEDAAEALGATYAEQAAGSFGDAAVLSFNGNKIITTSGGGMLLTRDERLASRVRHLSTQAREPAPHYEHTEVGYNYRLSNVLAALGRAQLAGLPEKVARRRAIRNRYRDALAGLTGVELMPEPDEASPNCWLTCVTIDPAAAGYTNEDLRAHLEGHDVESRPTWKPMHLQPVYKNAPRRVDGTAQRIFEMGLCLPSGSSLDAGAQERVIELVLEVAVGTER